MFDHALGVVARCPACSHVLLRLVRGPGRAWLDLRGLAYLQVPLPEQTRAARPEQPRWARPGHEIASAGADTRVLWGCFLDLVNAMACIGTAVALFPVVKRQNEAAALGFVTSRMLEAAIILIGVVSLLAVVTLRRDPAGAPGTDLASLITTSQALVAVRGWTFLLGPARALAHARHQRPAAGLAAVPVQARARVIPVLGLVGAPLLIASATTALFRGNDPITALSAIATVPIFLWELSLDLWLVVKGFKPSPITIGMAEANVAA